MSRRRASLLVLFALVLVPPIAAIALLGCAKVPDASLCTATRPCPVTRPAAAATDAFTVVTYNIYNRPWDRTERIKLATDMLTSLSPDIVALQEVSRWRGDTYLVADCWSRLFEMQSFHYWLADQIVFRSGQSLLSRFPITRAQGRTFAENTLTDTKGFVWAEVQAPFGRLGIVNAHLANVEGGPVKASQFGEIVDVVRRLSVDMPVLLLGDFNEESSTPLSRELRRTLAADDLYARFPPAPGQKSWAAYGEGCTAADAQLLDYILIIQQAGDHGRHLRFESGGVHDDARPFASDHCPVVARIVPE